MNKKLKIHDGGTLGKTFEAKLEYPKPKVATMSDMKCPFCQQKLNQNNPQSIECRNDDCKKSYFMYGSKELWQELIRTRKALDVAVDALKEIANNDYDADWQNDLAQATLEKIKDIK